MGGLDGLELGGLDLLVYLFPCLDERSEQFLPLLLVDLVLGVAEFY
jgi:hypothetical protein